jgi:hypothetical protein
VADDGKLVDPPGHAVCAEAKLDGLAAEAAERHVIGVPDRAEPALDHHARP